MTGEGRAHSQGPLEKAHTLTCRADEAYREGEFATAAKLYLEVDSRGLVHSIVSPWQPAHALLLAHNQCVSQMYHV